MEPQGVLLLRKENKDVVDIEKCIICQEDTLTTLTSTTNGRKRIIDVSNIRNDIVEKRLKIVDPENIVYHVSNECFKTYTLKTYLEKFETEDMECEEPTSDVSSDVSDRATRSAHTPRSRPDNEVSLDPTKKSCVICGQIKRKGTKAKYRISESERAKNFLKATLFYQDAVFTRTCDIQDVCGVYGADLYCHANCSKLYLLNYERDLMQISKDKKISPKINAFLQVVAEIDSGLQNGEGFALSDIRNRANALVSSEGRFENREIRIRLTDHFGDDIYFAVPKEANKSVMVFLNTCTIEQLADTIRASDSIRQCAEVLRESLRSVSFELQDSFCDANDLIKSWKRTKIPNDLLYFLSVLYNFDANSFDTQAFVNPTNNDEEESNESDDNDDPADQKPTSLSKLRQIRMQAIFQILFYNIHNGRQKTPLHLMNSQVIHETCKSSTLIKSFNHFGLGVSYDEIRRYHNDMGNLIVDSSKGDIPLPSSFNANEFTIAAFDNFDHEEATISGIGGSHDTVSVLFQEKSNSLPSKPKISETNVTHGPKNVMSELQCQKLQSFHKSSKKPDIPEDYRVESDLYSMDSRERKTIAQKERALHIVKLDLTERGNIKPVCKTQIVPPWSACNSIITNENLNEKVTAFLPVIPNPVTQYDTVYTALKNFQGILKHLQQSHIAVTCDEGVYHIAKEIQLQCPDEFNDIVLCMGSFHMMKIVLACIGKYLRGSGAETIWTECSIFGVNVVESVLCGKNYARSLKGMLLLSDVMNRLQWCSFFKTHGEQNYNESLDILQKLKQAVSEHNSSESKKYLQQFVDTSDRLMSDFDKFVMTSREQDETFAYWDNFLQFVELLKNLIRSDREGNWQLHVDTVQNLLPLFAVFDRTNYLRWCSLYLEDMRKLEVISPEVYNRFKEGKFVVKRTSGKFKAVGADMCLEQTINRSQKSSSGIIGSTRKKAFVAQWELIYHEMLAVSNAYREISGVQNRSFDMLVNHELNKADINANEMHITAMVDYIIANENPFAPKTERLLHNILTQEIVHADARKQLLTVQATGMALYNTFRRERFVDKSLKLSSTIHRTNLKTFSSTGNNDGIKSNQSSRKATLKEQAHIQRVVDVAQARGYDMSDLLKYDVVPSSYLINDEGLMTKPIKSNLSLELEKSLRQEEYVEPAKWSALDTTYMVDVMSNIRKIKITELKTFGEFADVFIDFVVTSTKRAFRIDFIFDTYKDESVKDSERRRRCKSRPIELAKVGVDIALPVDMDSFWSSNKNKDKFQLMLKDRIINRVSTLCPEKTIVLSGFGIESPVCKVVHNGIISMKPDLNVDIEEADVRIIPHSFDAVRLQTERIVILSNDTDVIVLAMYFWKDFRCLRLTEFWVKAGRGDSTRYIPIHILAEKHKSICSVLPAIHSLTGCDITSKFGTKRAALQAKPDEYLVDFGNTGDVVDVSQICSHAEEYLVQVLKKGSSCKTMDQLRSWMYHHSKGLTLSQLPPTSYSTQGHIQRACYATYLLINCANNLTLDPLSFGFEVIDELLTPSRFARIIPEEIAVKCNCIKCATMRCECRKRGIPCCKFCKCQSVNNGRDCKNPVA